MRTFLLQKTHQWWSDTFLRNSLIFSVASFGVSVLHYIFNLLVARGFSVAEYGEYLTALSYVTLLSIPTATVSAIVIKKVGQQATDLRPKFIWGLVYWVRAAVVRTLPLLVLGFGAVAVGLWWRANLTLVSVVFIMAMVLITFVQSFFFALLQAEKKFLVHGGVLLLAAITKVGVAVVVLLVAPSLFWLYAGFAVGTFLGLVLAYHQSLPDPVTGASSASFRRWDSYLYSKSLLVPLVTTLGMVGLANLDLILVKKFMPAEDAGLYGALALMGKTIFYVIAPVIAVAYSFFTGTETQTRSKEIVILVSGLFLLLSLAAFGVYWFMPGLVVSILFGQKYLVLTPMLWWGAVYGGLYSITMLFAHYFMAKNSWWGGLAFLGLACQGILIYFLHGSLERVIGLTVLSLGLLVVVYGGLILLLPTHSNPGQSDS